MIKDDEASQNSPNHRSRIYRGKRQKLHLLGALIASVTVIVVLFLPGLSGSGVVFHRICQSSLRGPSISFWLPLALVNAPYGGNGFVNASAPVSEVGIHSGDISSILLGGGIGNGTVWGGFFDETAVRVAYSNAWALGPGENRECSSQVGLYMTSNGNSFTGQVFNWAGGPQFGPSQSDAGEPLMFNFSSAPGNSTSEFRNGFASANAPSISTCGGPAVSTYVEASEFTTSVVIPDNGSQSVLLLLLEVHSVYHYSFPANFGTWLVDNLSEPGGPGGGWAFSYTSCA